MFEVEVLLIVLIELYSLHIDAFYVDVGRTDCSPTVYKDRLLQILLVRGIEQGLV
jgi:hypothetical protein